MTSTKPAAANRSCTVNTV